MATRDSTRYNPTDSARRELQRESVRRTVESLNTTVAGGDLRTARSPDSTRTGQNTWRRARDTTVRG